MAETSSPSVFKREEFTFDYVKRLAQGDQIIQGHFAGYFGRFLLNKLRHKLTAAQAIEDVSQETFLRVLRFLQTRGGLREPARLGAFVNTVCEHVLSEHYRTGHRFAPLLEGALNCNGRPSSLEKEVIDEELQSRVLETLDQLAPNDREVLRLFFFEEMNADEISRLWSLKRGHVRVLLHRAKNRFRQALSTGTQSHEGRCNRKKAVLRSTSASLASTA